MFFAIKVIAGKEQLVLNVLRKKAEETNEELYSIIIPPNVRGYLIVETPDDATLKRLIAGLPYINKRGIVGVFNKEDLENMLLQEKEEIKLNPGDVVEIVSGTLKGAKARVVRFNESKEEVTLELLESAIKIPVTLKVQYVKPLKKEGE